MLSVHQESHDYFFHFFSFRFLLQSPTVISLYVRYWDTSQLRLRTLQLQCQYVGDGGTKPTVPPFKPQHQLEPDVTTTQTPAQPPPKFQVECSSQHMTVKLPPVPTSGLIVQGEFEVRFINSHDNGASNLCKFVFNI